VTITARAGDNATENEEKNRNNEADSDIEEVFESPFLKVLSLRSAGVVVINQSIRINFVSPSIDVTEIAHLSKRHEGSLVRTMFSPLSTSLL